MCTCQSKVLSIQTPRRSRSFLWCIGQQYSIDVGGEFIAKPWPQKSPMSSPKAVRIIFGRSYLVLMILLMIISGLTIFYYYYWEQRYFENFKFAITHFIYSGKINKYGREYSPWRGSKKTQLPIRNYEPFCGPHRLVSKLEENANQYTFSSNIHSACTLPQVHETDCQSIFRQYYQTEPVDICPDESFADFCKLVNQTSWQSSSLRLAFSCDFRACDPLHGVAIGTINNSTGIISKDTFLYGEISEKKVAEFAALSLRNGNPFVFLGCVDRKKTKRTQLLVLPYISEPRSKSYEKESQKIDFSAILVDSVSRPHLYRSMPETIRYLEKLKSNGKMTVLDFELFHSLKGRTYENLQALFSGEIHQLEDRYEGVEVLPSAVKFDKMLEQFKYSGYRTLYQEDLCWEHRWGLTADLDVFRKQLPKAIRFLAFMKAVKESGIDELGLTHSSCEIFRSYGLIDSFIFPKGICYGGRFQHELFLEYIKNALNTKNRRPLFSFFSTNVGHEGTGRRIRTLDASLVDFLSSVETEVNTIHVLFSDHGNTYGPFSTSLEGRFEIFHPFMLILIPNKVAKQIGKRAMQDLISNQKMLITIQDLHFTLHHLLRISNKETTHKEDSNLGLFQPISPNRSCEDLGLLSGTLCICEGWKISLAVKPVHYLIAEFIVAKINKKIVKAQQKQTYAVTKGRICQQLIGNNIANVWQKSEDKLFIIGMDIKVQDGNVFSTIVTLDMDDKKSFNLKINTVDRLTSYGLYESCANPKVKLKYCICSLKKSDGVDASSYPGSAMSNVFNVATVSRNVHNECLYILRRDHKAGVVFEASNACWNVSYTVHLRFRLNNMKLAKQCRPVVVSPGIVCHLAVAIMDEPGFQWSYEYSTEISWKPVESNFSKAKQRRFQ